MSFWICARTHPNAEKLAIINLQNQDFDYYQPKILERKLRKQKLQWVEQPLFPCYLFVRVIDRWRSLNSTYGIASLINAGANPAIVRDAVIDSLKARELNGYVQLPKPKAFTVGDRVLINNGMFSGQTALVQRMPIKERQKVLLSLLSNKINCLVNEEDLIAA